MLLERMARVRCLEANSTTEQHDRQLAYPTDEQLTISRKHSWTINDKALLTEQSTKLVRPNHLHQQIHQTAQN